MVDTSIINVLMDHTRDHLIQLLMTDITEEDGGRAGLIKVGKLQDDPTVLIKNLMLREAEKPHVVHEEGYNGVKTPPYEIGGTYAGHWWYMFRVQFAMFFTGETDRDVVRTKANLVLSRAQNAIHRIKAPNVVDSFGSSAIRCLCTDALISEGGGPGDFNWRGEMCVEWFVYTSVE